MGLNIDTSKVDLGFVNPPVGRKQYFLGKAAMARTKKGEEYVLLPVKDNSGSYSVSFFTSSENETTARIAVQNLTKVWFAAGLSGTIKEDRLKNTEGKSVILDFQESKDGKFVNLQGAYPVSEKAAEEAAEEEEPEEEEEQEQETPAKAPWLKK